MSTGDANASLEQRLSSLSPEKRALLLRKLAGRETDRSERSEQVVPRAGTGAAPLSAAQELVWLHEQITPGTAAYNIPVVRRVRGPFNAARLQRAMDIMVQRHEALRTRFSEVDGVPQQHAMDVAVAPVELLDLREAQPDQKMDRANATLRSLATQPFDLLAGAVPRVALIQLDDDDALLLFVFHHIVFDGGSIQVFLGELDQALNDRPLAEPVLQFADYAAWEQASRTARDEHDEYWRNYLAGGTLALDIPADGLPASGGGRPSARHAAMLPPSVKHSLATLSHAHQATPYSTLLAAFQVLLHRYSGQADFVIGTPVSARARHELQHTIGFLVDTVPVRARLAEDPPFLDVLHNARDAAVNAFEHRSGNVAPILAALDGAAGTGAARVRAVLSYQEGGHALATLGGAALEPHVVELEEAKFDLLLSVTSVAGGLRASVEYRRDLLSEAKVARMLEHLSAIVDAAAATPTARVSELPMMTRSEEQVLLAANDTASEYPRHALVHSLFAEQAALTPDAPAIVSDSGTCTYAELDARSNAIAAMLSTHGVARGDLVGLAADRSVGMVAAVLGILKAGGAYLPLDPRYPAERLQVMLADSLARVVIVQGEGDVPAIANGNAGALSVIRVDADGRLATDLPAADGVLAEDSRDSASAPAYVMYTSGSTGKPKGVMVPHRAIVRLVRNTNFAELGPDQRVLGFAPISFDASTLELWGPLLNGGCLVLAPAGVLDVAALADVIERHGVTTMWLTAALFQQMADSDALPRLRGLRQLLAGGDVLSPTHVARVLETLPQVRLINGYGPTENTTFTCCHTIARPWDTQRPVPIGTPVANTQALILDRHARLAPIGVPGELYAAGDGVALGYLNDARLTAEKFVTMPDGVRTYRTGDRARWREDGTIEFLGRMDQQVKIRGFRVEPGEVEALIASHTGVQEAAVVARRVERGAVTEVQLAGYYVARRGVSLGATELRAWLRGNVPEYLVPSVLMRLETLPVGATGKVDRAALPAQAAGMDDEEHVVPRTDVERVVAGIFSEILDRKQVGAETSFLDLGGHSLLATRAVAQIAKVFRMPLTLRAFFESPTVAGISASLVRGEPRPGQASAIAGLLLKLQGMTPDEREQFKLEQSRAAQSRLSS